jgi:hypothetical protein
MYYREDKVEDIWYRGKEIRLPDGTILKDGEPESYDEWYWNEETPQEYLDWVEKQRLEDLMLNLEVIE